MNESFQDQIKKVEQIPLRNLELSSRCLNFLEASLEIQSLEELAQKTEKNIKEARGYNAYSLKEIKEVLTKHGLCLKEEI